MCNSLFILLFVGEGIFHWWRLPENGYLVCRDFYFIPPPKIFCPLESHNLSVLPLCAFDLLEFCVDKRIKDLLGLLSP